MKRFLTILFSAPVSVSVFAQTATSDTLNWNVITSNRNNYDNIPVITLSESETESDANTQNVAGILSASRDVFLTNSAFQLSQGGFRYRGYAAENTAILINGISMNDPDNGSVFWSEWGGLNDMFRGRQTTVGLANSTFAFGGLGGGLLFDSRAGHVYKGLNVGYAITNQRYRHRINASYASGFLKGDWAVAAAFTRRWAEKGYEPGTYYDGYSFFFSVEKLIKTHHSLSLTTFGAPTKSARAAYSTHEFQDLANNIYYNPAWGYQNGQIRNANISNNFAPVVILNYEGKLSSFSNLMASVSFQSGYNKYSGFDWYNSQNPAPDYYRNVPSLMDDSITRQQVIASYTANPDLLQIQWDKIYTINRNAYDSVENANGSGETVRGNWSRYVISDRVEKSTTGQFNTIINHTINERLSLTAGVSYQFSRSRFYKQLTDLLGGDFFVNLNQFAERDYVGNDTAIQYNADKMNAIVKTGDIYGYDYYSTLHKGSAWAQLYFKFNRVEFFGGVTVSDSYFWRTGNFRNGLFLDNSKGDSKKINSFNYGLKGGLQIKIDGRNYLYANTMYQTVAPAFNDAFSSPQLRNAILPKLTNEKQFGFEAGYIFKSPKISAKATFFYSAIRDAIQNYTYYNDDYNTMVNYSLSGINKRHLGGELGFDYNIWNGLGITAVANTGKYTYTSRPVAYITKNNDNKVLDNEKTIYWKNYHVANGPQMAYSLGLRYRSPQYWNLGLNLNYFDGMYVNVSPARRTADAMVNVNPNSETWNNIIDQEKLKGQFTMDLRGGYSWLLNKTFKLKSKERFYIIFNWTISNITNNTKFVLYANEQLRFDYNEKNTEKFATKYKYARGIGYFISLSFRMQ